MVHKIQQLRKKECGTSNHNDEHQSSCLCGDACFRCNLHRNIKKMIAHGEIFKRPSLRSEPVQHIHGIPNIEGGTTAERNLKQVMDMLNDDNVWCIGVWGKGGVGKSTLVKALNNKLKSDSLFTLVKLVELKENDENKEVQEAIAKSLELNMEEGFEDQIRNTLEKEKFLLILDNVWSESIHLSSIGIPERQIRGSKIILTTRSHRVCTKMEAKAIEIGCPTEEEAWQLFAEKAGDVVNDEKIKTLAKKVCNECGYLPLALVVVGSAMKGETNIDEWRNAVNNLQSSVPINNDIESKVYNPLKLSYDSLDDTLRACFLYCSLYPEGCYIEINELVQCWLAENLIDGGLYHTEAYHKGLGLIKKLKESCLLEGQVYGDSSRESERVKMHDVVRDVARWIGRSMNKSTVFSGHGISSSPIVTLPDEVNFQWISFVDNREIKLPENEKDYPSVTTLVIGGKGIISLHDDFLRPRALLKSIFDGYLEVSAEFLNGFQAVKVLNMVGIKPFAASLLQLKQLHALILRFCNIEEVPTANNLKILDLSFSYITHIPRGTKELSMLKVLKLSHTFHLERVDADTIRNLNLLEVLDMSGSTGYRWPVRKRSESEDQATMQDLSKLQWLREVYLQLAEADSTYEEFVWMERLKVFYLAYDRPANRERGGKFFVVNARSRNTKVGSFIVYADTLSLYGIKNVNEIFASFSSTDQSNSKLKSLMIKNCDFSKSSTPPTVPKYSVLLNVEELHVHWSGSVSRFSEIINAIGTNFFELRSLTIGTSVQLIFCSADQIVFPKLEKLSMHRFRGNIAFSCSVAKIQEIAPTLRRLEVKDSSELEGLCYFASSQQWRSLEILEVINCPNLKEFPLMPSIKEIRGNVEWWDTVEWDSKEMKSHMNQYFKPLR